MQHFGMYSVRVRSKINGVHCVFGCYSRIKPLTGDMTFHCKDTALGSCWRDGQTSTAPPYLVSRPVLKSESHIEDLLCRYCTNRFVTSLRNKARKSFPILSSAKSGNWLTLTKMECWTWMSGLWQII